MPIRTILAAFLFLAGCAANHPARENASAAAPATTQNQAMRGLQSLTRVQLQIPGVSNAAKADAVKQLREQLPQLDTAGSSDDWTLEFVCGWVMVPDTATMEMTQTIPNPPPAVYMHTCHCRLFRTAIVDRRFATAVAYEGPLFTEKPTGLWRWRRAIPDKQSGPEIEPLLLETVAGFAQAWREANLGSPRQSVPTPPVQPATASPCGGQPADVKTRVADILARVRIMGDADKEDLAAIKSLSAKINKDATCPPDKGDNIRYYSSVPYEPHALSPREVPGLQRQPSDEQFCEFHMDAAGRPLALVWRFEKGGRHLTDRFIYEGKNVIARLNFGPEGFQQGEYALWTDGKLRTIGTVGADGKVYYLDRVFWKGDREDYTVHLLRAGGSDPDKFRVYSVDVGNTRVQLKPDGTIDHVNR